MQSVRFSINITELMKFKITVNDNTKVLNSVIWYGCSLNVTLTIPTWFAKMRILIATRWPSLLARWCHLESWALCITQYKTLGHTLRTSQVSPLMTTLCFLPTKKLLSHPNRFPVKPYDLSLVSKWVWGTESKAFAKLKLYLLNVLHSVQKFKAASSCVAQDLPSVKL